MKFFYVYVLQNKEKNFVYIGYSENLKQRFKEHNSGKSKSTKHYIPLKWSFYEAYLSKSDAKRSEAYLKSNNVLPSSQTRGFPFVFKDDISEFDSSAG